MKKQFILLLVAILLFTTVAMSACGQASENADVKNPETEVKVPDSETKEPDAEVKEPDEENGNRIVNFEGTEFNISLSKKGEISENPKSMDSNEIEIAGKTYSLPIKMSDLMADGWHFSENISFKNEFNPGKTSLISFNMYDGSGHCITLKNLYNGSTKINPIEDCLLYGIEFSFLDNTDFELPGGINNMSYAADVLEVFGNPNVHTGFKNGYNQANGLYYLGQNTSKISYYFSFFGDDQSIEEVREHIYSIHLEYDE